MTTGNGGPRTEGKSSLVIVCRSTWPIVTATRPASMHVLVLTDGSRGAVPGGAGRDA